MKGIVVLMAVVAASAADFSIVTECPVKLHFKGGEFSELFKALQKTLSCSGTETSNASCTTPVPPTTPVPRNKTFYAFPTKVNWHQAMVICNSHDLRLASVESELEQTILVNHLKSTGLAKPGVHFWASASNLAATEQYHWFGTGKPMTYTNWMKSEPNNNGGNEHCAEVRGVENDFKWNDLPCSEKIYFICQDAPSKC